MHYSRWMRHGDPLIVGRVHRASGTPAERFWPKVDRSGGPDACWTWTASRLPKGYGVFVGEGRRRIGAHRFSWLLHNPGESIPEGMYVCHRCDNPPCVNPAHLFLGSPLDNALDMIHKGRHRGAQVKAERCSA